MSHFDDLAGLSDATVLAEVGRRLARHRLNRNLAQDDLAREAGISPRTLHRIEHGQGANLTNLVRLLRALGLLENLDALVPEPAVSPLQQAKLQGRGRRRASRRRDDDGPRGPWTWGDEE